MKRIHVLLETVQVGLQGVQRPAGQSKTKLNMRTHAATARHTDIQPRHTKESVVTTDLDFELSSLEVSPDFLVASCPCFLPCTTLAPSLATYTAKQTHRTDIGNVHHIR